MSTSNAVSNKIEEMNKLKSTLHILLNNLKINACNLVLSEVEKELIHALTFYIKAEIQTDMVNISIAKTYLHQNEANIMKTIMMYFDSNYHYDQQDTTALTANLEKLIKSKMFVVKLKPLTNEMLAPFKCTTLILKERGMNINCDGSIQIKQALPSDYIAIVVDYKKKLIAYQKHKSELAAICWAAASISSETEEEKPCFLLTLLRKICCWFASGLGISSK